ncbi:MAG: amylo-alpha-1,6-glucosidase [archaeon]
MKVIHRIGKEHLERDIDGDPGFLLANRTGSYLFLKSGPRSRFHGYFYYGSDMFRIIENIEPLGCGPVTGIVNGFSYAERLRAGIRERFSLHGRKAMMYRLSSPADIEISLDIKASYDNREFGRNYQISQERDCIVISFIKSTDPREDQSGGVEELSLHLAIRPDQMNAEKVEKWVKRTYADDQARNSPPWTRYVYVPLRLKARSIAFSVSESKKEAIQDVRSSMAHKEHGLAGGEIPNPSVHMAYLCSVNSLCSLAVGEIGVFAGLPWFFQFWIRDEAISARALRLLGLKRLSSRLVMSRMKSIGPDGRIAKEGSAEADGTGWVFRRIADMMGSLSKGERRKIQDRLEHSIYLLEKFRSENGFEKNRDKETWMDSEYGNDTRSGIRIEIQCLRMAMYKLMTELSGGSRYLKLEKRLKARTARHFWCNGCLKDGLHDPTVRPNIFLAAYLSPCLLSKERWTKCFDTAIERLWLPWGGFATIDKEHPLYCNEHTGQDPRSYHRGDSWFWINNLAALVLFRHDRLRYGKYITKIMQASTEEILWRGAIGHHAELSSARELRSEGCAAQAWSAAMYIELVHEIFA